MIEFDLRGTHKSKTLKGVLVNNKNDRLQPTCQTIAGTSRWKPEVETVEDPAVGFVLPFWWRYDAES